MRRIIAYIDAFSFYYGLTKFTRYRWCNIYALCQAIFPNDEILKVNMYAGRSKSFPTTKESAEAPKRQDAYIRALRTHPKIEVFESQFSVMERWLPIVSKNKSEVKMARVKLSQEKETDVKLSSHMVFDAATRQDFDSAAIFTNDIDFIEPIRIVREKFGKKVYLVPTVKPDYRKTNMELIRISTNKYFITSEMLANSQFSDIIIDSLGRQIHKPSTW